MLTHRNMMRKNIESDCFVNYVAFHFAGVSWFIDSKDMKRLPSSKTPLNSPWKGTINIASYILRTDVLYFWNNLFPHGIIDKQATTKTVCRSLLSTHTHLPHLPSSKVQAARLDLMLSTLSTRWRNANSAKTERQTIPYCFPCTQTKHHCASQNKHRKIITCGEYPWRRWSIGLSSSHLIEQWWWWWDSSKGYFEAAPALNRSSDNYS